jgi:hypothetical protein
MAPSVPTNPASSENSEPERDIDDTFLEGVNKLNPDLVLPRQETTSAPPTTSSSSASTSVRPRNQKNPRPLRNGKGALRRTPVRQQAKEVATAVKTPAAVVVPEVEKVHRPKTPGAFPESFIDDQPVKIWVESSKADHLGVKDLPVNHPHYYSKVQYENDSLLLDHYGRHRNDYYRGREFLTIVSKADLYTASGITSTFGESKWRKIREATRCYTIDGDQFLFLTTPVEDFFHWLNRFRAGPSRGVDRDSISPEVETSNMAPITRANSTHQQQDSEPASVQEMMNEDEQFSPVSVRVSMPPDNQSPRRRGIPGARAALNGSPTQRAGQRATGVAGPSGVRRSAEQFATLINKGKAPERNRRPDERSQPHQLEHGTQLESPTERRERELANQQALFDEREAQQQARIRQLERLLAENNARPEARQEPLLFRPHLATGVGRGDPALISPTRTRQQRMPTNRSSVLIDEELDAAEREVERLRRLKQQRSQTRSIAEPMQMHHSIPEPLYRQVSAPVFQTAPLSNQSDTRSKLRPSDVMSWDPAKHSVQFFINRFESVASVEGTEAVLRVLPLCLAGDALDWHTSLPRHIQSIMNTDVSEWILQLNAEFKKDTGKAHEEAYKLRFRFDNMEELPLNSYLRKKRALLYEAGVTDDATVIYQTWQGLDVIIAGITPILNGESWLSFCTRVRQNESAAFRSWKATRYERRRDPPSYGNRRGETNTYSNNNRVGAGARSQSTMSGRVEKSSPKKASPRKSPPKRREPLTNTAGNRREWIPKEKWDEMRRTGTLPPRQKLYLIDDEDETEVGDQSDTGSTSSQMDLDTYALAGVTLSTPVKE